MKLWIGFAVTAMMISAQEPQRRVEVVEMHKEMRVTGDKAAGDVIRFVSSGPAFETLVTGKPYSGEATTEAVQTLGDGTRITNRNTTKVYRDKDGRTRREQALGTLGAGSAVSKQLIFIHDPVAKADYVLDPETRIARKITLPDLAALPQGARVLTEDIVGPKPNSTGPKVMVFSSDSGSRMTTTLGHSADVLVHTTTGSPTLNAVTLSDAKKEDLGKRTMEGLECTGTRMTSTIDVGKIGNDRPIVNSTETWTSTDLGLVVYSKTSDPRAGETTYTLRSVQRVDPPASLFAVPADYKVEEMGGMKFNYRIEKK
jgi:hypothetical protein